MSVISTCIIVDDDEIDRLTVLSFVRKYPSVKVQGVYATPEEAIQGIGSSVPDIAFLDVDMPGMSGLEMRRRLMQIPAIVFITAYPDYAVEGFELEALDYIVKPLGADRFARCMERITAYHTLKNKAALLDHHLGGDTLFIKEGHQEVKINLHEVIYLEALRDYTAIITTSGKHCVLKSLGNLLLEKGFSQFIRIHKSYAVQKQYIQKAGAQEVQVRNSILPVGRAYKEILQNALQP
ncbi:MAG: response regulator transcription factor [Chitinophagales bacterium]|jgi:DNA-binding LytR/AlgR family response regulator|nr:response regulator transcription factor [Chitinophagales bacterium]